jgi:outer membrane immunogenic protein
MRKLLVGVLFLISGAAGASAADLAALPLSANPLSPGYSWNGFYVGGALGGAAGHFHAATSTIFAPTGYFLASSVPAINAIGGQSLTASGALTGGVEAGYNLQISNLVFGFEADFDYLGLRGNATSSALYPCCAPSGFMINSSAHTNWLVTARPRLGYAYDNWLFFVSGGLAATNLNASFSLTDNNSAVSESGSLSKVLTGYAIGGGVEAGLWANWTVKAEYLYLNFGKT